MSVISLSTLAEEKRTSIVRIVCQPQKSALMTGTGFFIDSHHILTCAHVVLGHINLRALLETHSRKVEDVIVKDAFHVPLPYGFVTPIEDVLKVVKKFLS